MDLKQSDIGLLIALDAMLDLENVTLAAERLGISQPAMSAQLARLRKLFNDPLLTPSGRKLVPTARALEIKSPLGRVLADMDLLVRESAQFDPYTTDRRFRIVATDYAHAIMSNKVLDTFKQEAPNAQVALLAFDPPSIWPQLEHDDADLVLATGMNLADARRRRGLRETFKVIQSKRHPRGNVPFSLDDFCAAEHILISPAGGGFIGATDKILNEMGRSRRIVCSVPNFLLAPAIVAASDYVALIPTRLSEMYLDEVYAIEPPFKPPTFDVDLLWHPRRQNDPAHIWLRNTVSRILKSL